MVKSDQNQDLKVQTTVRVQLLNIWFTGATGEREKETQSDEQPAQAELLPKLITHDLPSPKISHLDKYNT